MYRMLKAKTQGLQNDVVDLTRELIQTPSASFEESAAAEVVERSMKQLGYNKVFRDEAGNVVGIISGIEGGSSALLTGHLDTVPPGDEQNWTHKPYSGDVADGAVHGVGAADCKGGIAAQVYAGALLKRSLLPLKGDLVVAATVAEANGRSIGVRTLMEKTLPDLGISPQCAILGEPTGLGLYYGHDGWMEVEVTVQGANPFIVDDAADAIYHSFEEEAVPDGGMESLTVQPPSFGDEGGVRTATIGIARRLRQTEAAQDVITGIRRKTDDLARPIGAVAVDVAVRRENRRLYTGQTTVLRQVTHAWMTDPFCPEMDRARQSLAAAGVDAKPARWELGRLGMGTAGSVFVNKYGIPAIGFGPGTEDQAHAAGEHVRIDRLADAVYGTAAIAHGLVGIPVFGWDIDEI
jgi:acetylornithine deacetylase/succinyl-diaminopimelate desuccinylase-like protein